MRSESQFSVKQIVWGKVGDYPWWPAKVVKNIVQDNHHIYKVYFFGDPTQQLSFNCSCYLQSYNLLDFQTGLTLYEQHYSTNLILKKSIQLAKAAYKKTSYSQIESNNLQDTYHLQNNCFQQSKLSSKLCNSSLEKIEFNDKIYAQLKIQVQDNKIQLSQINQQNVINFINSQMIQNMRVTKGYNNKKYLILLQNQLKKKLLQKYHLFNISKYTQFNIQQINYKKTINKNNNNNNHNYQKFKKIKKIKYHNILPLSSKKLYQIIKQYWNLQYHQSQQLVIKIIQILNQKCGSHKKMFYNKFMKIIQCIKHSYRSYQSLQYIVQGGWDINRKHVNFQENTVGMEEEYKKQDQEKSKVTQIEAETH